MLHVKTPEEVLALIETEFENIKKEIGKPNGLPIPYNVL